MKRLFDCLFAMKIASPIIFKFVPRHATKLRQYPRTGSKQGLTQQEEEQIRKLQRQEKAANKFSKQRFMRNNSPSPKHKTEEPDPSRTVLFNLIKKNLKVDVLQRLSQLVRFVL